jgi:hypothetical protein
VAGRQKLRRHIAWRASAPLILGGLLGTPFSLYLLRRQSGRRRGGRVPRRTDRRVHRHAGFEHGLPHALPAKVILNLPSLAGGTLLGLALFGKVNDFVFRRALLCLLFASGVAYLV